MKPFQPILAQFDPNQKLANSSFIKARFLMLLATCFSCLIIFTSKLAAREVKSNRTSLSTGYSPTAIESIRANLYLLNANGTTILADGVLTEYNNKYHDIVTLEDAYKFTNINENLGLTRYGKVLAVERRPIIVTTDTLYFKLWKTTQRNYKLEFVTSNLNHPGMDAYLEDKYLAKNIPLDLNGKTIVLFNVNGDAASSDVSRFRIIYKTAVLPGPLPVSFSSVTGVVSASKVLLDWKVENELNVKSYEIERSMNGSNFITVAAISTKGLNTIANSYSWIDDAPLTDKRFYRIKSVDLDGSLKYSIIVKVNTSSLGNKGYIMLYPNPVKGNLFNLTFTNQQSGIYQICLIDNAGRNIYSKRVTVNTTNTSHTLDANKKLPSGIYFLSIKAPDNTVNIQKAVIL